MTTSTMDLVMENYQCVIYSNQPSIWAFEMCDLAVSEAKINRDDTESVGNSCGQKQGGRRDEESAGFLHRKEWPNENA